MNAALLGKKDRMKMQISISHFSLYFGFSSLSVTVILITLCGCGSAAPVSKHVCDDLANQNLIISNTEAPGEEVMVSYTLDICKNTWPRSWSFSYVFQVGSMLKGKEEIKEGIGLEKVKR